ncbi:MAG: hypothetical protein JSW41_03405 [Candidatus Aenigmatarchaeota archaeon]|nr:MAG: hypothetical protein JSW41_03405 [Candidatus Aenigmarchaeota archaeon]
MSKIANDQIFKEIALETGVSEKLVKDVINNGQSKCTAQVIAGNTFDGVKWPYLGKFKAKHKTVQILMYMKGLNPIQKEFFLAGLKQGRFKDKE